jgi:hypothetical protein
MTHYTSDPWLRLSLFGGKAASMTSAPFVAARRCSAQQGLARRSRGGINRQRRTTARCS